MLLNLLKNNPQSHCNVYAKPRSSIPSRMQEKALSMEILGVDLIILLASILLLRTARMTHTKDNTDSNLEVFTFSTRASILPINYLRTLGNENVQRAFHFKGLKDEDNSPYINRKHIPAILISFGLVDGFQESVYNTNSLRFSLHPNNNGKAEYSSRHRRMVIDC